MDVYLEINKFTSYSKNSNQTHFQQDHVQSLESLKAELAMVTDKKSDLERRLTGSLQDKENLMQQLDEANDRIVALERQLKEQVWWKRLILLKIK